MRFVLEEGNWGYFRWGVNMGEDLKVRWFMVYWGYYWLDWFD